MSADLAVFLRARLDEDEAEAEAASDAFLHGDRTGMGGLHPSIRQHVYRWTSARAFREVTAKRARLQRYLAAAAEAERFPHGANVMVRDALLAEVREDAAVYGAAPALGEAQGGPQ